MPGLGARHVPARLPAGDPDVPDRRAVLSAEARPLYHRFAWAYDLLVEPTGVTSAWIARALGERGVAAGELVVDAGCGTGRQARELAAAGYRVIGVDRSANLIGVAAREASGDVEHVVADLLDWRPREPAAAVLCRGVLNDLTEDADRDRALASLARMLRPGGLLVADVRDRDRSAERYARPRATQRSAGDVVLASRSSWDGEEIVVDERIRLGADEWRHEMRMRPWTREELERRLAAGFESVELHHPAEAGARGDRIVFSARARA